jgi:GntR family transcriptional repressor for pyruvate dehydrogenase complex
MLGPRGWSRHLKNYQYWTIIENLTGFCWANTVSKPRGSFPRREREGSESLEKAEDQPEVVENGSGNRSAVDEVVAHIRDMIEQEALTVGDSLPTERELCGTFGASRNTVREAMRILKAYGVVDVRPKVGATIIDNRMSSAFEIFSFNVTEVSRDTFSDIQGFRCLLEVASVEEILERITPADISELRRINAGLKRARPVDEASENDFQFHTRLIAVLGNKAILDVYRLMKPVILRIMKRGKSRHTFETTTFNEHLGVLDALEARDRLAYQYRMKTHLNAGYMHFKKFDEQTEATSAKELPKGQSQDRGGKT